MAIITFRPVNNSKSLDSANWTGVAAPGPDVYVMDAAEMYFQGGIPVDQPGVVPVITVGASPIKDYTFDLEALGDPLSITTASGSNTNVNVDVGPFNGAVANFGGVSASNVNYNVVLSNGTRLIGSYSLALTSQIAITKSSAPLSPGNVLAPTIFENNGKSGSAGAHVLIDVDVTGTGSFYDGTGQSLAGVLEFGRSVAATETVNMVGYIGRYGDNVELIIDRPSDFHAAVTLDDGTITLKGLTADSYSYDNTTLTLFKAGAAVDTLRVQDTTAPLFVSQVGADVQVFSEAGMTPLNHLPQSDQMPGVAIYDTTTNSVVADTLSHVYQGPVAGLQTEFIDITTDSLNITALKPNAFLHTGAGNDAIDVSKVGGTNVLDGGQGSNFLVGGAGADTFFVDARNAPSDTWSTVVGFHGGDAATLFGVSQAADRLDWSDNGGAVGATGLTLHAYAAGKAPASITLAGFSQADLTSGKLTTSFGNVGGSDYLYLHAA